MTHYTRTENGSATDVDSATARQEINHAMMSGRKSVRTMSSITRTDFRIEYKDGRVVTLVRQDGDRPAPQNTEPTWSTASHRMLLHRFTEDTGDGRALCNKGFRPYRYGNGYSFETRTQIDTHRYAHLYTYCPRCLAK